MPLGLTLGGFFFCTSKTDVTAPQQCGAATAFSSSFNRVNGVGYNTADNTAGDPWQFIGASFEGVGTSSFISLNSLTSPDGIDDGDQIQIAHCDENGTPFMKDYEYWDGDGWVDLETSEPVGDEVGFELGHAAWFISSSPKSITTAGQVKNVPHIHTFTEPWTIVCGAFPVDFCPNGQNISWGCLDGDQIQVAHCDENGTPYMKDYEYWDGDGWVDLETSETLDADFALVAAGKGFWFITASPEDSSFTEVSPLANK